MSGWITSTQRGFIERTLRVLGHSTLILVASLTILAVRSEYSHPVHATLDQLFSEEPLPPSAYENVSASEIAGAVMSAIGKGGVVALFSVFSIPFYWLAHFLRLGREDKPEGGKHKGASA